MKHLKENNETYFSHLKFAGAIGIQLTLRGIILILHGLFPVCEVPKSVDLNNTCELLSKWNNYARRRKKNENQ
jgi:hypothetical protein